MFSLILARFSGPLGRWAGIAAAVLVAIVAASVALVAHDHSVRATLIAKQTAAQAEADATQQRRIVATLGVALAEQRAAAARLSDTLEAIHNAPATNDCTRSPAADEFLRRIAPITPRSHP